LKKTKRRCNIIAPSVILPFDGLNSAIPAGFTRETLLDGKYPKGTAGGVNPNTTGGSTTHSHTSSNNHTHTLNDHTHSYTTSTFNSNGDRTNDSPENNWHSHYHTGTSGGLATTYTSSASNPSWSSASNEPPYYTVIFIKSSGYNLIPNNAMVFSASTSRSGLSFHTASANRFLKGASAGANAGGTGGSTTHAHTFTHNHGNISHNHSTANCNIGIGNQCSSSDPTPDHASYYHVHSVSFTSANSSTGNNSTSYDFTNIEPAYRTLNAFKNTSGASKMPAVGDIALWLGSLSSIPVGWKLCDGSDGTPDMRGRYYKNNSSASSSSTGGSNTHTHSQTHTHSTSNHTHSFAVAVNSDGGYHGRGPNQNDYWTKNHSHNSGTTDSQGAGTTGSGTIIANSSSNEPEYRTVAFIQFEFPPVIPNPILMMMVDSPENV
jgi:hypothetical protein